MPSDFPLLELRVVLNDLHVALGFDLSRLNSLNLFINSWTSASCMVINISIQLFQVQKILVVENSHMACH